MFMHKGLTPLFINYNYIIKKVQGKRNVRHGKSDSEPQPESKRDRRKLLKRSNFARG